MQQLCVEDIGARTDATVDAAIQIGGVIERTP
jgi:hypothetical protein